MRIAFLIQGFGVGGAQKQCIYLLNALQNDPEVELHLVYFYEEINFSFLKQEKIQLHKIGLTSFYNPYNIVRVGRLINEIKPDIIFSWLQACDVYAYFITRLQRRIKWVMAERDSHYPNELRFRMRNAVGRRAHLIIANSGKGKLYWQKRGVTDSAVTVISNILTPATAVGPLKITGSPIITYAGRFEPQKNVLTLINSFCQLAGRHPAANFLVIGQGAQKDELTAIIERENKRERITIMPFQKNIHPWFAATDVFVSISLHEGLPNTIMENISLGNRIVASRIPEHEAILGADYPYLVDDFENSDSIVKVVEAALREQDIERHLVSGKAKLELMSPEKISSKYKEAFNKVLLV